MGFIPRQTKQTYLGSNDLAELEKVGFGAGETPRTNSQIRGFSVAPAFLYGHVWYLCEISGDFPWDQKWQDIIQTEIIP